QRFLALNAREMEDDVLGAYRLAVMEHQGEPAERVVADGEQENARLADPGGRAILRAHREGERRGNGFLVPAVEPDRVSGAGQREPQADSRPARSDDADRGARRVAHPSCGRGSAPPPRERAGRPATWPDAPAPAPAAPADP